MADQTVAEAVLAAVNAGEFPWVDWEPGQVPMIDSNGNPVIDSNGNPVLTTVPWGYVFETDTDNYWYGPYSNGVRLAASTGAPTPAPGTVAVPDLYGLTVADARAALAALNLTATGFQWEISAPVIDSNGNPVIDSNGNPLVTYLPAGCVFAQSPAAGAAVLPGSYVALTLSLGVSP
jgi:hypothetical protein